MKALKTMEFTGVFELLVSLLRVDRMPGVVDGKQEVRNAPTVHPARPDRTHTTRTQTHRHTHIHTNARTHAHSDDIIRLHHNT